MTIALQNLIVFGVGLADNLMLGGYSEAALSGVALANQIQFLLQMMVMGVGEGIVVLSSQYWGKKDPASIRKIITAGLWIGLAAALLLGLLLFFFPDTVLGLLTDDEAVIAEGVKYVKIICFTYGLFAVTNILLAALRSVETVKIAFAVSSSTLVIDVCLNYILIYGKLGAPALGVRGAAVATLAARIAECLIVAAYLRFGDRKIRYRFRDVFRTDASMVRKFVRVGLPVLISNTMWGMAMAVQTSILGHLGGPSIAANSIASTVFQIVTVICYGSGSASGVLTGKTIGEGCPEKIRRYAPALQAIYLVIGICTGLLLFFLKDFIVGFYAISQETKALALQFMWVLSVTVVGTSYQVPCLTGLVRGGGDTRFVLYNDTIFMWGVVIPLSLAAAYWLRLPPAAVFACLKCDQILKCFVAVVKVNRGSWIRQLTGPVGER